MASMGRMPAMGSLANGKAMATAPIEFAIDVDGAAAHALHDAGVFEGSAGETGEDEGFLGADIVEHSEDFDLKVLDFVPVEYSAAGAAHSGFEVFEGKERSLGG